MAWRGAATSIAVRPAPGWVQIRVGASQQVILAHPMDALEVLGQCRGDRWHDEVAPVHIPFRDLTLAESR